MSSNAGGAPPPRGTRGPSPSYPRVPRELAAPDECRREPTDDAGELAQAARRIRRRAVMMIGITGLGYLGQATSSAEIFAVLYRSVVRHGWDRFVLSPGHYAVAHYAAAADAGLLAESALGTYGQDGSWLESISTERTPLLSATCGALGQGLSVAAGLALADSRLGDDRRTYVFCSDGEMEEGQVWEAAMFAGHHRLGGLTAVFDCNGSQVDGPVTSVTTIEPVLDKWRAFGWHAADVDGHDVAALRSAFSAALVDQRPSVVLARTSMLHGLPSLGTSGDAHFVDLDADGLRRALDDTAEPALGGNDVQ